MRIAFSTSGTINHEDYQKNDLLGTEFQVFGLCKEFIKKGHEVYIIRRWYNHLKKEEIDGIKIINVASPTFPKSIFKDIFSEMMFSKYAAKELEKIQPDVLNLTAKYSSVCMFSLKIPKVFITHTLPRDLLPSINLLGRFHPTTIIENKIFANSLNIALNEDIYKYLNKKKYKTICIPNGVDLNKYMISFSDENFIFFGGRFVKSKGLNYLIEAYSLLSSEMQNKYKLVLCGFGHEKKNLEKLVSEYKLNSQIIFWPFLDSPQFIEKIKKCTVFVLPSLYETFGNVVLEAMACGKPVIASNISGPKHIITHGENGFLFEKSNAYALVNYLQQVLNDTNLRIRIGKNARKTIEERYNFENIAKIYLDLYGRLTKEDI